MLIVCFFFSNILVQASAPGNDTIISYGAEADRFVDVIRVDKELMTLQGLHNSVINVVSDMHGSSVEKINKSLDAGAIIVAINSSALFDIAGVPKIVKTESTTTSIINADNTKQIINSTVPVSETIEPCYVISVFSEKPFTYQQNFMTLNYSVESQQELISGAKQSLVEILTYQQSPVVYEKVSPMIVPHSTRTTLLYDYDDEWDTAGPYYDVYSHTDTVDFGTGQNDHLTQNVFGKQLQNHNDQYEYYRFDITTDHDLGGDYVWNSWWYGIGFIDCGPYMTSTETNIDVSSPAYLLAYDPITTSGSSQTSVDIGISIDGPSVGWGWTWDTVDVSYDTSYSSTSVGWDEIYAGPDYYSFSPPPSLTHNSYRTTRSAVFQEPLYNGITVYQPDTTFNFQMDNVAYWPAPVVQSTYYTYTMYAPTANIASHIP